MSDFDPDPFDTAEVQRRMQEAGLAGEVHRLAVATSTNTLALDAAKAGAEGGLWVADTQTAGRGRAGHQWHSAPGDGLYMSLLVRPRLAGPDALKLSLAAGLAARTAVLANTELAPDQVELRWPNDLIVLVPGLSARKFGGILTESSVPAGSGSLAYAVIGIGLNLNHAAMPPDLAESAASVRMVTGIRLGRQEVLSSLLPALAEELYLLEQEAAGTHVASTLAGRFEQASGWVRGLRVHVEEDGGYTGHTCGLDSRCMLQVRLDDGSVRTVRHGGVRRASETHGLRPGRQS